MAETSNIALMAEMVSDSIFSVFGWRAVGGRNQNWECARGDHLVAPKKKASKAAVEVVTDAEPIEAEAKQKRSHPSDVVFCYADPYRDGLIFVQTDLKSYGGDSIKKDEIAGAVRSLCMATECANVADGWKKLYEEPDTSYQVCGLLFVYNHDEKFDASRFPTMLEDISDESAKIAEPHRVFVMGPGDVLYLFNVATSLGVQLRKAGDGSEIETFYPELSLRRSRTTYAAAATIETLLAPWQIFFVKKLSQGGVQRRTLVYYRGRGANIEEFEFLLEYLLRHHVALLDGDVEVRLPDPDEHAPSVFEKAKASTLASMHSLPEFRARLNRITYASVTTVAAKFSSIAIGMGSRE